VPDFNHIQHPKKRAYLKALSLAGTQTHAAEAAGIDRTTAWHWTKEEGEAADQYREALEEAREAGADYLEAEAIRRATSGVQRLKFHQGTMITVPLIGKDEKPRLDDKGEEIMVPYVEHEYSDVLLIFMLKGYRPEKFKDRAAIQHEGNLIKGVQIIMPEANKEPGGNGNGDGDGS